MPYTDSAGQPVPDHVALDTSGRPRPGYRHILAAGEPVRFDIMAMDAAPAGAITLHDARPGRFVSPAEARQAEIMADCARTAEARRIIRDAYVGEQVAKTMAHRSSGTRRQDVAALRDARLTGQPAAVAPSSAPSQFADTGAVRDAIRAARYA
ncbi:hypothetical protein [Novosphingobium sp.]|uniref:hypothetical protein n=1 Tax=Novosphingobium sp. TaxID=1874826 RepID=UPI0026315548|nr:hypothetical protein [Novosphingobium sp.]